MLIGLVALPGASSAFSDGAPLEKFSRDLQFEGQCADCHVGPTGDQTGSLELHVGSEAPGRIRYAPGERVGLVVTMTDPNAVRFGFRLAARYVDTPCEVAGSLRAGVNSLLVQGPVSAECGPSAGQLEWLVHSTALGAPSAAPSLDSDQLPDAPAAVAGGSARSGARFAMEWVAPDAVDRPVEFTLVSVAANGDGMATGDRVTTAIHTIQPARRDSAIPDLPAIRSDRGVVLADGRGTNDCVAPLALALVHGTGFTTDGTQDWVGHLLSDRFPSVLGGTCVTVNGTEAPLKSVTATEIEFQVPDVPADGSVAVQVIRDCRSSTPVPSAAVSVQIAPVAPALLPMRGTPRAVAALHGLDRSPVGPKNLLPGVEASPAAAGELVSLFATGLGPVTPPLAAGYVASDDRPLASTRHTVYFGGEALAPERVHYVGAAPGFLGMYRLDIRVPDDVLMNEFPVSIAVDGVPSPGGLSIPVASLAYVGALPCQFGVPFMANQACFVNHQGAHIRFDRDRLSPRMCMLVMDRNRMACHESSVRLPGYPFAAEMDESGVWTIVSDRASDVRP